MRFFAAERRYHCASASDPILRKKKHAIIAFLLRTPLSSFIHRLRSEDMNSIRIMKIRDTPIFWKISDPFKIKFYKEILRKYSVFTLTQHSVYAYGLCVAIANYSVTWCINSNKRSSLRQNGCPTVFPMDGLMLMMVSPVSFI